LGNTLAEDDSDEDISLSASSKIVADKRKQAAQLPVVKPALVAMSKADNGKPKPELRGSAAAPAVMTKTAKTIDNAPPKAKVLTKSKPTAPGTVSKAAPIPTKEKSKNTLASSQQPHSITVDEEVLEFGKPAQAMKLKHDSPLLPSFATTSNSNTLALPTSSTGLALPSSSGFVSLPTDPSGTAAQDDDDDEWDEAAGVGDSVPAPVVAGSGLNEDSMFGDGFADQMEEINGDEINVDQFAAEMDKDLLGGFEEENDGEGEEGDGAEDYDMFGEPEEAPVLPPPRSTKDFAGERMGDDDDDDDDDDDHSSTSDEGLNFEAMSLKRSAVEVGSY
jgi:hypothetical protein